MLAGTKPQPRLDRVLARCIDLVAYGIFGFAQALRLTRGAEPGEAVPAGLALAVAIVAVLLVLVLEVGPAVRRKPSLGKQLFALRVDSTSGGMASVGQMIRRAIPLAVVLAVFIASLRTPIEVWWLTLSLAFVLGLVGLIAVIRDRPTPWDRLAGTRVVSTILDR